MGVFQVVKLFFNPYKLLRLLPFTLIIPIVLFDALSLSGCVSTSPGIPGLYVVSLRSTKNTTALADVQVRIGYFGICGTDGSGFRCQSSSKSSASDAVTANLFPGLGLGNTTTTSNKSSNTTVGSIVGPANAVDVHELVATALELQVQIFISILAGGAFLFASGLVFLVLHKRDAASPNPDKPRRSAILKRGTYGLLYLSAALVFTASLATSETAGALAYASSTIRNAPVLISEGIALPVLQWMAFGFTLLFTLAVPWIARPGYVTSLVRSQKKEQQPDKEMA
ncbi:Ca2+ regulator and membrane fusion protein Fig1-domain-containing protein [Lasiosphaeria miniovina]|uniref:Ca2+ regulator and membrane fusion protein Fig1-domain-containing protein n=1 Tax=Lasiosphaeria miniovina TaxID=1954250 RepID=A0AA40B559_9PEZI|nr:Ca2+ regulator and membrane fusion protein Fig1-domain-containing protein [Lasiosphaeria miniovina]KAK0727798.1 Ca2+ regulator and membrane fusion protein Fig1-domain-containing protein [Lasiosphaeria miniovina]